MQGSLGVCWDHHLGIPGVEADLASIFFTPLWVFDVEPPKNVEAWRICRITSPVKWRLLGFDNRPTSLSILIVLSFLKPVTIPWVLVVLCINTIFLVSPSLGVLGTLESVAPDMGPLQGFLLRLLFFFRLHASFWLLLFPPFSF